MLFSSSSEKQWSQSIGEGPEKAASHHQRHDSRHPLRQEAFYFPSADGEPGARPLTSPGSLGLLQHSPRLTTPKGRANKQAWTGPCVSGAPAVHKWARAATPQALLPGQETPGIYLNYTQKTRRPQFLPHRLTQVLGARYGAAGPGVLLLAWFLKLFATKCFIV